MSHMTTIDIEIQDVDALEEACARIEGLTFVRGKTKATYYGHNTVGCKHAIEVNGSAFDIAVVERGGKYFLQADFYGMEGQKITKTAGQGLGLLKQAYGIVKAKKESRKKGWMPSERKLDNGKIRVTLRRS